jgi:nucleoside-diphosphate-sugar epimerase
LHDILENIRHPDQLDIHYAIGNFIRDGLQGGPIEVKGDGTSYRSYLYAADLTIWLWTILFRGESNHPYNVGSEKDITIAALAKEIAIHFKPELSILIKKKRLSNQLPERYIPSNHKIIRELGVHQTVDLNESIKRTIRYERQKGINGE